MGIFQKFINKQVQRVISKQTYNKVYEALYGMGLKYTKYEDDLETYVSKGYNSNADIYSVVSQKATEITRIPYYIKSIKDEQSKERYYQFKRMVVNTLTASSIIKKTKHENKAFEEKEMPMPLDKPNPDQTWREFFALYETFMDLTGNFYIYLRSPNDGGNAGVPIEMYILPSHLIDIVLHEKVDWKDGESPINYYILKQGYQYIKFERENVVHIKYPNPNFDISGSHLYGQSPLRAALKNMESSNAAIDLKAKTLANGGVFGFISTKEPMGDEQAKSIKNRIIEMDESTKRLSNIGGASQEVVFTRISLTTDELKPFEHLEYDQKAICNVLHWDDKLLNNDSGAKYDNYKTAIKRAIINGISPNLRLLEEAFNREILPRFKSYRNVILEFDEGQLPEMQEDMEKLSKWLNDSLDRGVINRDEYRAAINYTELGTDSMLMHTVSMNVISLDDALTPAEDINFDTDE